MRAIIDREGRISLSQEIQEQLGVKPGDEVLLENCGNAWIIKAANSHGGLCREGNVLVHRGTCSEPVEQAVDEIRDGRLDELSKGLMR